MNINCVICSDLFISADSIFTTPCGHIFHHACLMQWMERSKSCPQCRNKCTERNIFRIYFNNMVNLDSTQNTANLLDSVDNLTLQMREKDQALKEAREQRLKLEETLLAKEKEIEKLDTSVSRNVQIIARMRHEIDILSSHRASIRTIETENAELKSKLELLLSIESVLTASQQEVDEILKQKLNARDLAVMVGTLRRELNSNELRKSELRKQMNAIKNDLRAEQELRRKCQEKVSFYESENHTLKNQLRRLEKDETSECDVVESSDIDSPEPAKRPRLAQKFLSELNTPSPMTQDELRNRAEKVKASDSPYLMVKSSSIALASVLKKPMMMKEAHQTGRSLVKSKSNEGFNKLSIFNKPRLVASSSANVSSTRSENVVYNGIGGTTKVLQSDLKKVDSLWSTSKLPNNPIKRKKLSPSLLGK